MVCVFVLGLSPLCVQAGDLQTRQCGKDVVEILHHHNIPRRLLAFISYLLHWIDNQYSELCFWASHE